MLGSGIQIRVLQEDLLRAQSIIGNDDKLVCPDCGSHNIDLATSESWKRKFFIFLSFLSLLPMGNLLDKYQCKECKATFNS